MSTSYEQQSGNEDLWKQVFGAGHPDLVKQHRFHARLPRDPRCKLCFAPFEASSPAAIPSYSISAPSRPIVIIDFLLLGFER